MKVWQTIRTEATSPALRIVGESLSDGVIISMVLKGLLDTFNSFSMYVIYNCKELAFSEFKTPFRSSEDTEKYRHNLSDDNVMKLSNLFPKRAPKESDIEQELACCTCDGKKCGDLGINSKTPNRILTRRLPDTKCINASPRIRLHASIRLKIRKKKNNKK